MALINRKDSPELLTVCLLGHIDSGNAGALEEEIRAAREESEAEKLLLDAEDLEYISSAGLRVILRLRKQQPDLKIVNVSPEVYEILDMTGFTEMMEVRKAYRKLSVQGCEIIVPLQDAGSR